MVKRMFFLVFVCCSGLWGSVDDRAEYVMKTAMRGRQRPNCSVPEFDGTNYVTLCHPEGGQFASQLILYAMVLGYAWENNLIPIFPKEVIVNARGGELYYDAVFFRLPQGSPSDLNERRLNHISSIDFVPVPYWGGNVCLCGVRHQLTYFHRYRDRIREMFAPSETVVQTLREKYSEILDHPKTVAVHVRTYHPGCAAHQFLGEEYYQKAMDYFSDDHLFVICSDRIGWCKEHLKRKNIVFVEGNTNVIDFYLMAFCKNIITTNSTFGWAAAYLKHDKEGMVLAPQQWWGDQYNDYYNNIVVRGFYPEDWVIVPNNPNIPRNYEVLNYPTTSLDEQF